MEMWSSEAAEQLAVVRRQLDVTGALSLLEESVAGVYRANVGRYEPTELFDTPLSLGIQSNENLRTRVLSACADAEQPWRDLGVRARADGTGLVVVAAGYRVRPQKAPPGSAVTPRWSAYNWAGESEGRVLAARLNQQTFNPRVDPYGQLALPDLAGADGDASLLRDLALIWRGDLETGLTSAWLGFPTLGQEAWLAIEQLWQHTAGRRVETTVTTSGAAASKEATFDQKPQPQTKITLRRGSESGQS